jgi:two-component system, chemotaxis family, CheB/CheR fusion protein
MNDQTSATPSTVAADGSAGAAVDDDTSSVALTIVAIGASAGGLVALREFFGAANGDPRIAYVVVTHLPSHHVSHLAELLGRTGVLPSRELSDGEQLAGGQVHVMPPGQLMALRDGAVRFEQQSPRRSPAPKPIDYFMTSLAEQAPDRCVGIVLSGTDHDGTMGLKAIKAAGGLTLVQAPETAEFPGMPQSAITADAADRILAPRQMPAALNDYLGHLHAEQDLRPDAADEPNDSETTDRLGAILSLVHARTGNDFRLYRSAMLQRRLRRRMVLRGCDHLVDYMALLEHSPDEASALSSEFLIGVTDFFRDPEAWQEIERSVLPPLLASRKVDDMPFRVWTPGCSSGEESYSIAMVLQELLAGRAAAGSVQVFGTDIDHEALSVARKGVYPEAITETVAPQRLARFFDRRDGRFVVRKSLRDAVMFAPQNLVRDTPFSRLDMVLCRNVLMYFDPSLQERVLQLFHFALKPGGLLWLGKAESLGVHGDLFEPVAQGIRLFRRVGGRSNLPRGYIVKGNAAPDWQRRAMERAVPAADIVREQLGERRVDTAVLIDRDGRALHFRGDTTRFLAPQGDASLDLLRLIRPELRASLRTALRQVLDEGHAMQRRATLGGRQVTLEVEPVASSDNQELRLVLFSEDHDGADLPRSASASVTTNVAHASELDDSRRELALALDDAERINDELRHASEESSSLNEELQSSNEELESSKEELQSLNEELATVNAQLEDKVVEVTRHADDVANLLHSTHIATVLLDRELRIRRFTPAAAELFHLRTGDEGRRLSDLASTVDDAGFVSDAHRVLASEQSSEAEVRGGTGSVYLRRILPYRTGRGDVEGTVATFIDITPLHNAARQARQLLATLEDSNDAVLSYDRQGRILSWNEGARRTYGYDRAAALGLGLFALMPDSGHEAARQTIEHVCTQGTFGPENTDRLTSDGRVVRASVTVSPLRDDQGRIYALLSTERDVTERLHIESEMRFRRLADDIPTLLRVEDAHGMAEFVNRACAEFTGRPREALLGRGWLQFVHSADRDNYLAEHTLAHATQTELEKDFRLLRADGAYRWMRSISVPHTGPDGQFAGFVSLMIDVEDRKRAESALLTADRRKDEFLAMLAHELRNPLAPIGNAARVISGSGTKDDRILWAAGVIGRQTTLLTRLLDSLLDVARIASGKAALEMVPVDLSVVVARAVEISDPLIDERHQQLRVNAPAPDELVVEGDMARLTQVLANLLNNASKYTDAGGEICVDVERTDTDAVIHVSDCGAGLAADMIPRIFDLFSQADRTLDRAKGGLGLGLTIVRQLVELHGGSVEASSPGLGMGSRFTVRLPLLARAPAVRRAREAAAAPIAGPGRRILVVDDNVDGAMTLAQVLQIQGHEVTVAHSGAAALEMTEAAGVDVAILDIGLPGMDGYSVARNLRGRPTAAKAMLIALTGYSQPEDIQKALDAGFDRHMVKPVDLDQLSTLIARR